MSLFGSIVSKIFGGGSASAQTTASPTSSPSAGSPTSTGSITGAAPGQSVDVGQVLGDMAAKKGETLNYKQSIVDLMKLLDLDSSISARKQLAEELHYTGNKDDSATMNVWLHKQVMTKLAENGGKVPADLQHA